MPTITVDKADLFRELGKEYTKEEFENLCFEFGIELDEDTTDEPRPLVDGVREPPQLKIEIPANRYDMLCFEGIALNLRVFLQKQELPRYSLSEPAGGLTSITVTPETKRIRPFVAGAILRNVTFDKKRYDSFISLQDKLHQNLARNRTLVAIGTHDLDKIHPPFTYEALSPESIKFTPLNQTKEMNAAEIMQFYEKDRHLGRYLHIIRDSPVYPVIYDSKRTVMSMPPIINGDVSKISEKTKNIFIEATATDATKLDIIINIMATMFSAYSSEPFTIEPVNIVSPHNSDSRKTPNLAPRSMVAEVDYINSCCGLQLSPNDIAERLKRMGYNARRSRSGSSSKQASNATIDVLVPPTRADVLHPCDVMEDVAISHGLANLPRTFPSKNATIAAALPLNKLGDIIRLEAAMAGWSEVLPLILCSHDECFGWLNRKDDGQTCVRLQNPKTMEYQIVRTSLVPGLLKCVRENRRHAVPMKVFECSDVCFKDLSKERKSRNERHFAAVWYGRSSGFEMVHGLLDRLMKMLRCIHAPKGQYDGSSEDDLYWIEEQTDDSTFLKGHVAAIHVRLSGKHHVVGTLGILHPSVLKNFELAFPASTLEFNVEPFL